MVDRISSTSKQSALVLSSRRSAARSPASHRRPAVPCPFRTLTDPFFCSPVAPAAHRISSAACGRWRHRRLAVPSPRPPPTPGGSPVHKKMGAKPAWHLQKHVPGPATAGARHAQPVRALSRGEWSVSLPCGHISLQPAGCGSALLSGVIGG
jgi:hypothetical protein